MIGQYKNRKQVSTAIDIKLYEKFKKLSKDTRIASTKLLDEAIEDLLVKYDVLEEKDKKCP